MRINRLELVRPNQAAVTFALGLNDQVFPDRKETKGLLSSEEREVLNQALPDGQFYSTHQRKVSLLSLSKPILFFFPNRSIIS